VIDPDLHVSIKPRMNHFHSPEESFA
jgi:hypothetical protein